MTDSGRLHIKGYRDRSTTGSGRDELDLPGPPPTVGPSSSRCTRSISTRSPAQRSFRSEIASLTRLGDHPHVVELLDHGLTRDRRPFLVVPYFRRAARSPIGSSGPDRCRSATRSSSHSTLADVLQFAHDASIVHRDIKPSNVLFDDAGEVMVGDFGIAVIELPGEATLSGAWVSPAYVAPEVVDGGEATTSSDLYSLGATLYAMLAGRAPFAGSGTILGQLRAAQALPVPPIERDDLPPELIGLVDDLLAKDPRARPRTADEVAIRVRAVVDEYGFSRSADPRIEPAPPRRPRRRTLVGTVLSIAIVIGALTVGLTFTSLLRVGRGPRSAARRSPVRERATPRKPMASPPFGLVEPVVHDRGTDTTPRSSEPCWTTSRGWCSRTDWRRPNPIDTSSDSRSLPRPLLVLLRQQPNGRGLHDVLRMGVQCARRDGRASGCTERTQASITQFDSATDAHAYFTGMSVEFGADADECRGLPRAQRAPERRAAWGARPCDGRPPRLPDRGGGFRRGQHLEASVTDRRRLHRLLCPRPDPADVTLLYLIVGPPGSDPTPRLLALLRPRPTRCTATSTDHRLGWGWLPIVLARALPDDVDGIATWEALLSVTSPRAHARSSPTRRRAT